jgi:hypothetical protein
VDSIKLFILLVALHGALFGLLGCSCEIQCSKAMVGFSFVGYDSLTLDTVIVRRFDKTNAGDILKDTLLLPNPDGISYMFSKDTATMGGGNYFAMTLVRFQSDWNYEVFVPAAGKTFHITDIIEIQRTEDVPCYSITKMKRFCLNQLSSVTIDNRPTLITWRNIYLAK